MSWYLITVDGRPEALELEAGQRCPLCQAPVRAIERYGELIILTGRRNLAVHEACILHAYLVGKQNAAAQDMQGAYQSLNGRPARSTPE